MPYRLPDENGSTQHGVTKAREQKEPLELLYLEVGEVHDQKEKQSVEEKRRGIDCCRQAVMNFDDVLKENVLVFA